jgi:dihydroneopterin aldolase/2-amino-4-hydroxy-6-hydroxymethyldihydropteridine diphosphokinase
MPRVFVGVGSNIDPERNVREALRLLRRRVPVAAISTFYRTDPEGRPEQPPFYNGVVEIATDIPPEELKRSVLRQIEDELGRRRTDDKYAPRTIDLDVLVYGDRVARSDEITVPDPQIESRAFLAVPLYELAPDLVMPGSGVPLRDVAATFEGHDMKPLIEYTEALREDVTDGL